MSEGFFSRWSRRKQEIAARAPDAPRSPSDVQYTRTLNTEPPTPAVRESGHSRPTEAPGPQDPDSVQPLPTLEDVQRLTPQSDFQPFMQRGVGPEVRNAAMKKLFADPHFNVMDGLDIYIDDYNRPDPMPAGMLHKMASAQFLKLVPEEAPARQAEPVTDALPNPGPADGIQVVAQSPDSSASADPTCHDDPDLQLQPDPAPADPQPGPGPR